MLRDFGIIVIVIIVPIVLYNGLVKLRVLCDNAWADIDIQLKRRHDLIPNLLETVKGAAAYEKGTLEAVISARSRAMTAQGPGARAEAEGALTQALRQLFVLAEAYPQLRAVESFRDLQVTLTQIEDALQNARRYYNAVVRDLNTRIAEFPWNLIADLFGFKPREFFEIAAAADREAPTLGFQVGGPVP